MSGPVDRLQGLLTRVQQNRGAPRVSAQPAPAAGSPIGKPPVAAAAQASTARAASRAPVAEDRVSLPEHRAASRTVAEPAKAASRVPGRDRLSTPLEMAVEEEIGRAPSEPPTTQIAGGRAAAPATAPRPAAVAAPRAPARASDDDAADFVIEAEPPKEGARAIAQTVSKHAPELDVTFGALLRRSLSLRPR